MLRTFVAVAGMVVLAGCAHRAKLVPAASANRIANDTAEASNAGVRIVVTPDKWSGDPDNLSDVVTPLWVRITNDSGRPLQLRYSDFTIVTGSGFRSAAIPPFKMEGSVAQTVPETTYVPGFGYSGFFVAPYYSAFYGPALSPWPGPFAFDTGYWSTYYVTWREPLPTTDMLNKAIPEGVLESHGYIDGYLYFQKVHRTAETVDFKARLVDAKTEQVMGSVDVPFDVRS